MGRITPPEMLESRPILGKFSLERSNVNFCRIFVKNKKYSFSAKLCPKQYRLPMENATIRSLGTKVLDGSS